MSRERAIVIGAGIVGAAAALRLAQRSFSVRVLDGGKGAATNAAAGILGAQLERHPDPRMQRLCLESRARYAEFVREICSLSGSKVELSFPGSIHVARDEVSLGKLAAEVRAQRVDGLEAEMLDAASLSSLEPALAPALGAARYMGDGVLEPRELLAAAVAAARSAGAVIDTGVTVRALSIHGDDVVGVVLESGETIASDEVILAAGSWSGQLEGLARLGLPEALIVPARGQMIELGLPARILTHVVEGPDAYLSPRDDGRVLVGSTVEHVGFEVGVTAGATTRMLAGAIALLPALESAKVVRSWSGFRAETPDGMPILCRAARGLIIATGHFRNGVLLGPVSGDIVAALATAKAPAVDVEAFGLGRFGAGK